MAEIKVYTLDEVADILKLTRRTMYSYVKEGKLKASKIGKYWRVSEKALNEFIEKGSDVAEGNLHKGKR